MQKIRFDKYKKREINYGLLFLAVIIPFLKYNFKFPEYVDLFYILYFAYLLFTKSDTREPIAGGLVLLVTLPLLLIANKEKFAEIAANGAYYLLVVGVLAQLIEFLSEKKKDVKNKN